MAQAEALLETPALAALLAQQVRRLQVFPKLCPVVLVVMAVLVVMVVLRVPAVLVVMVVLRVMVVLALKLLNPHPPLKFQ